MSAQKKVGAAGTSRDGGQFWAAEFAWYALLGALVLSPLAMNAPGLFSGTYFTKDLLIRSLVSLSLLFWGYAALMGEVRVRWHRGAWLAVGVAAWVAVSTVLSPSPSTAIVGPWPAGEPGLLATASYLGAAFLTLQLADRSSRIRDLLRAVVVTSGVVALHGLLQTVGIDPFAYTVTNWGAFRSFGTMGNPDMFGAFMVLALPVTAGLMLSERDSRWRNALGVVFLLVGTATFTSLTRSAWVGAIAAACALVILLWTMKPKLGRFETVVLCLLLVSIAAFALISLALEGDSNVGAKAAGARDLSSGNAVARFETWRAGAGAIAERPITGWGPGTFLLAFEAHRTETISKLVDPSVSQTSAHNWVVQTAAELGIVGLLIYVSLLFVVALVSARWIRRGPPGQLRLRVSLGGAWAACAGFLVTSLLTPGSPPSRLLFWCLLAVLLSPEATRPAIKPRRDLHFTSSLALALGAVGVVLAGVVIAADAQAAKAADVNQVPATRAEAADAAVALNPLCAEYRIVAVDAHLSLVPETGLAEARGKNAEFDEALAEAERAVELEPTNPYRRAALVATLLIGGQDVDPAYAAAALMAGEDAREQAPNNLYLAYWYARALRDAGRDADAVAVLDDVLAIRPAFEMAALLRSEL